MTSQPYDDASLPLVVTISEAFSKRLPSQRVLDLLDTLELARFGELAETQPFRIVAFRALLRDFPDREPSELWAHAYYTEVDVETENPTNGKSTTPAPSFAATGE